MKSLALAALLLFSCFQKQKPASETPAVPQPIAEKNIQVGAESMADYLPRLEKKRVALVVNQTSLIGKIHLADTLKALNINVLKIFAPEHGFRGEAGAGEKINDGRDEKTDIPIVSIYGKKKKPSDEDLAEIEVVVFDIQDVGCRFFTYLSTLFFVMEACAEQKKQLILLDRPNPNGHFVDGPVLEPAYKSFVGQLEIPIVHGCTMGEMAKMINGEGWLSGGKTCDLRVIPCKNYGHAMPYELPVHPSPNLPNQRSVLLYPSICLFEGTNISLGRGTPTPFQILGNPAIKSDYCFTPMPCDAAKDPFLNGKKCCGIDLNSLTVNELFQKKRIDLGWLFYFKKEMEGHGDFFLENNFFDKLAGNSTLRKQILAGKTEAEIRETWQPGLADFLKKRKKYLLYPDF